MSLIQQLVQLGKLNKEKALILESEIEKRGKSEEEIILENGIVPEDFLFKLKSENLNISYLFQEPRLLPWFTVYQNINYVLDSLTLQNRTQRVNHYINELELTKFKDYYPHQLSGGMKQRVSLARAFVYPSNTILMDEPFKGLDLTLKLNLFKMFNKIWREDDRTTIFVTHDIHEAILLGDKIILLTNLPTKIDKIFQNKTPYMERSLHNPLILELEKELYTLLT